MKPTATVHTQNPAKRMAESVLESPRVGVPLEDELYPVLEGLKLGENATAKQTKNGNIAPTPPTAPPKEGKSTETKEKKGECIIFVGDLSRTVKDQDLRKEVEKYGTVINIDIKRDRVTNNNLGYGFVQFSSREEAVAAKKALHGKELCGRRLRIGWAQRNTTLFVGDLDNCVEEETYRNAFEEFGDLVYDETYFKVIKGFGMVKFKTRENAERAKMELHGKKIGTSKRPVRVTWADTSVQKHCVHVKFDIAKEAKSLQEGEITEDILLKVFSEFGKIVQVNLPRHNDNSLKGYGFVHYEDTEEGESSAKTAIERVSGAKIGHLVVKCNYGRKHTKRRRHTNQNNVGGGGNSASIRQHNNQIFMYQYGPQNGTYAPTATMVYPMQTPYIYQQQQHLARRGGPSHSTAMYPPAAAAYHHSAYHPQQAMSYYPQYSQSQAINTNPPPPFCLAAASRHSK